MAAVAGPAQAHNPDEPAVQAEVAEAESTENQVSAEVVLQGDIEVRKTLAFRSDRAYVEQLQNSPEDMGTAEFGIPLTAIERQELGRRQAIVDLFSERMEAAARARPDYGGIYMDHPRGGKVVVLTTGNVDAVRAELLGIEPGMADDLVVEHVDVTEQQLIDAMKKVIAESATYFGAEVAPNRAEPNIHTSSVDVYVPAEQVATAAQGADDAARAVGVPVNIKAGGGLVPQDCRPEYCINPMRAGTIIREGSYTGPGCTMGFHIKRGTANAAILTAGHCHTPGASNKWYHKGWTSGHIGSREAALYYQDGVDVMRINIADGQYSNSVYTKSGKIRSASWPRSGWLVCVKPGKTLPIQCGTVANPNAYTRNIRDNVWTFGTTGGGVALQKGDSGAPWWRSDGFSSAVGVHSGNLEDHPNTFVFANVMEALDAWDARIP